MDTPKPTFRFNTLRFELDELERRETQGNKRKHAEPVSSTPMSAKMRGKQEATDSQELKPLKKRRISAPGGERDLRKSV
tara:strand:- start:14512 stop:14748 length:237 start_codon:yes stop_codon:yes gene_type:complete